MFERATNVLAYDNVRCKSLWRDFVLYYEEKKISVDSPPPPPSLPFALSLSLALSFPLTAFFQLSFNHPSFDCVVRDSDASSRAKESDFATPPATEAAADGHDRTADLTLSANALLRVNVDLCVPWEAMPSKEPLRLVGAKALMR